MSIQNSFWKQQESEKVQNTKSKNIGEKETYAKRKDNVNGIYGKNCAFSSSFVYRRAFCASHRGGSGKSRIGQALGLIFATLIAYVFGGMDWSCFTKKDTRGMI